MIDEEIWCCVRINTFTENYTEKDCNIEVDSIGTKEFATEFCDINTARGNVKRIWTGEALALIADDILEHDDEGLRYGNWLHNAAARKLEEKLKECT